MLAPTRPADEDDRLSALYDYEILDTAEEKVFDEIAQLAATICGTRYAAITLVDRDRQWFKAAWNLDLKETARDLSVCSHAILEHDVFVVPDTDADARFAGNPVLAGAAPRIRFYGGSQLNSQRGHAVGMLCVLHSEPHELTDQQRLSLKQLADLVTAILEAGRRLRQLMWFGELLDNIGDELLVIDPESLRYLHANRAAQENLGFSLAQLRSMTPMEAIGDPDRARFVGYVDRLKAGEPVVLFGGTRERDGVDYPVESRWQLLASGTKTVVLSLVQDVTERRQIERMKEEFMSIVSHELRTPLTSIHGAIRLLEQGAAGELPPHAAHLVELAGQNTQRLRHIIDDILDLEKIASGKMEFQLEPLRTREVLERAAQAFEALAQAADVLIMVEADSALHVLADARRLQQVLANLVSNALKFAPEGSTVRLTADTDAASSGVRLSVSDTGAGVPAEFTQWIFQRFSQAEMENSRSHRGSGLGLSIAKQMTEQMNGRIGFESRPGSTTFWVDLPHGAAS